MNFAFFSKDIVKSVYLQYIASSLIEPPAHSTLLSYLDVITVYQIWFLMRMKCAKLFL